MPPHKKNIVTTEAWPEIRRGRLYEARIKNAVPDKAAGFLQVTAENLDPSQSGRIHEIRVPLPVRPGNRACAFLAACGIDATAVGSTVELDRITNVIIGIRFLGLGPNGSAEFDFERVTTPPATKTAVPAAGSPEVERSENTHAVPDSKIPF